MKKFLVLFSFTICLTSCDESILDSFLGTLTQEEIAEGLISALDVGLGNAVIEASGSSEGTRETEVAAKGFVNNELIKILLPEKVKSLQTALTAGGTTPISGPGFTVQVPIATIYTAYKTATGVEGDLFDDLIQAMNEGAQDAALEALPIFGGAIKNLTFSDALNILQGTEDAATNFFFDNTNQQLITAFAPKIDASLSQTQANAIYEKVAGIVNYEYKPSASVLAGFTDNAAILGAIALLGDQLNVSLSMKTALGFEEDLPETIGTHATTKAVDGLFKLIAIEEKEIRTNPAARVNAILTKVFGSPQAQVAAN